MSSEAGFTLLELLVAIALLALVSLPVSLAVGMGVSIWQSTHEVIDDTEYTALVRSSLRKWLEAAYPFDVNRVVGEQTFPMAGSATDIVFSAPVHPDTSINGLYRVNLSWSADSQDVTLKLTVDPGRNVHEEAPQILLTDVTEFEFSYLTSNPDPQLTSWGASWQSQYSLPAALRIRLQFADATRKWNDLVVPVQVVDWAHCAFDEVSRECRTGADAG